MMFEQRTKNLLDLSSPADPLKDSFSDFYKKIVGKANGGVVPSGGFEIPAVMMLNQVREENADYIIHIRDNPEEPKLSGDNKLIPPVRKPEVMPKKSEEPFDSPFGDVVPVGMFGKALEAHSKLIGVLKACNKPVENVDRFFKDMWGVDRDIDLAPFHSVARSTGPAMWGGLGRKAVPVVTALPEAQVQVDITDKGRSRHQVAEDALVDWPKAKSVAMATGLQLAGDDKYYPQKDGKRDIYLKIEDRDIPRAPKDFTFPTFPDIAPEIIKHNKDALIALSAKMRKMALITNKKHEHIEIGEVKPKHLLEAVRAIPIGFVVDKNENLTDIFVDINSILAEDRPVRQQMTIDMVNQMRQIKAYDLLPAFATSYADKQRGNIPRASEIRASLLTIEDDNGESIKRLRTLVNAIYPDNFLLRVHELGTFMSKGAGIKWVNTIRDLVGIGNAMFTERDLIKSWIDIKSNLRFVKKICEYIAQGFVKYERIALANVKLTRDILRLLCHDDSTLKGMSMVIERHAIYWNNRYLNKVCHSDEDLITNQLLAKCIRKIKFITDENLEMVLNDRYLKDVLANATCNYIDKRQGIDGKEKTLIDSNLWSLPIMRFAMRLDELIKIRTGNPSLVSMFTVADKAVRDANLFKEDVQQLIDKVVNYEDVNVPEDYMTASEMVESKDVVKPVVPQQEKSNVSNDNSNNNVQLNKPTVSGTINLGLFKYTQSKKVPMVHLREELIDDNVNVDVPVAKMIISHYPEMVELEKYEKIKKKILEAFAELAAKKK